MRRSFIALPMAVMLTIALVIIVVGDPHPATILLSMGLLLCCAVATRVDNETLQIINALLTAVTCGLAGFLLIEQIFQLPLPMALVVAFFAALPPLIILQDLRQRIFRVFGGDVNFLDSRLFGRLPPITEPGYYILPPGYTRQIIYSTTPEEVRLEVEQINLAPHESEIGFFSQSLRSIAAQCRYRLTSASIGPLMQASTNRSQRFNEIAAKLGSHFPGVLANKAFWAEFVQREVTERLEDTIHDLFLASGYSAEQIVAHRQHLLERLRHELERDLSQLGIQLLDCRFNSVQPDDAPESLRDRTLLRRRRSQASADRAYIASLGELDEAHELLRNLYADERWNHRYNDA